MSQAAQNLRDILALARMLRGLASGHDQDPSYDQFLSTATELEARAHALATTDPAAPRDPKRDTALHAPVDLVI